MLNAHSLAHRVLTSKTNLTWEAREIARDAAAEQVIKNFIHNDMILGLGSGATAATFVRKLGVHVAQGLAVQGVATSEATAALARHVGINLIDLRGLDILDLAVDSADEVDPQFRMIKGGGACLMRERIVACATQRMVVLIDEGKLVDQLGHFPLPVEVAPFGYKVTQDLLARTFENHGLQDTDITLRMTGSEPVKTDGGNYIFDCACKRIDHPESLLRPLESIPGVLAHGLFLIEADYIVIGGQSGRSDIYCRDRT